MMSERSRNLTCVLSEDPDTDLVKELGLDFSGEEWDRPATLALDIQMSKWFGRILGLPGTSADRPSVTGSWPNIARSEPECDPFDDPSTFPKLTRFAIAVADVQTEAVKAASAEWPERDTKTHKLPCIALAYELSILKHLSEVAEEDRTQGGGKFYPRPIWLSKPYTDLPQEGPLLDHETIASSSPGMSIPDKCAAAQKRLTEHWHSSFTGKPASHQQVSMVHKEYSRAALVEPFDERLGRLPSWAPGTSSQKTLRQMAQEMLEWIAGQSAEDPQWLADMSKLSTNLDLADWVISDATTRFRFTKADAQAILDGKRDGETSQP
jgi:hypothetical protein